MRTPETIYLGHKYIKFYKHKNNLMYKIWQYSDDGMASFCIEWSKVKDEQHLKELQSLGSVKT